MARADGKLLPAPAAEKAAKEIPWDQRTRPEEFTPVQVTESGSIIASFIDWWNTRSPLLCCCFPFVACCSGHTTFDGTDSTIWKEQLEAETDCPESMKGVWWLKYNHAPEELITIFSDANFSGNFNEEGTDGYGQWNRPMLYNWTRDNSILGHGFAVGTTKDNIIGFMNLKDGKLTTYGNASDDVGSTRVMIYRVNDDEWWKTHYKGDLGEEGQDEVVFMYKWLKVIDKDGNTTKFWPEYVEWAEGPLPHSNCGTSWFPCWGCCLSPMQVKENMITPNKTQIVKLRR
jgi:hypothetical protein